MSRAEHILQQFEQMVTTNTQQRTATGAPVAAPVDKKKAIGDTASKMSFGLTRAVPAARRFMQNRKRM